MPEGLSVRGAVAAAEKNRGREYTAKQKKFLTLYANNEFQDSRKCAEEAGYPSTAYHKMIVSLKEDIKEIASAMLLGAAPEAAGTLIEALSSGKVGSGKIAAAKEVLDRVGIVKQEMVKHEHEHTGGIFIIPAKSPLPEVEIEGERIDG